MTCAYRFDASGYADRDLDAEHEQPAWHEGPVPLGLALAARLARDLTARGWRTPSRWVTPAGHGFEARGGGDRFDVTLACVDPEAGRWSLDAEPRRGLLPRLRRRDPAAIERLCGDLRAVLAADPTVGSLVGP